MLKKLIIGFTSYKNHGHVTTIQLLALGRVDNKMRTQFVFFLQMYIQMIIKTVQSLDINRIYVAFKSTTYN